MQNRIEKVKEPKSSGCGTLVWTIFWTLTLISALVFCFIILQPLMVKIIEKEYCRGQVVHRPWGGSRKESIICIDQSTGKEKNISEIQIFACCPSVFLMLFLLTVLWVSKLMVRKIENL